MALTVFVAKTGISHLRRCNAAAILLSTSAPSTNPTGTIRGYHVVASATLTNSASTFTASTPKETLHYRNTGRRLILSSTTCTPNPMTSIRSFATSNAKKDFYQLLSVPKNADKGAIKKAYFQLAKKYHPDTNKVR